MFVSSQRLCFIQEVCVAPVGEFQVVSCFRSNDSENMLSVQWNQVNYWIEI